MIRRSLTIGVLALAVLALGGCSLLGWFSKKAAEPDTLAKWAVANGVSMGQPASADVMGAGTKVSVMPDGKGYKATQSDKTDVEFYFVPLGKLDSALDADLRHKVFPDGVATIAVGGMFDGSESASADKRKVSESELEQFYLMFSILPSGAKCENFTKPCDIVVMFTVIGKLKGQPLFSAKPHVISIVPAAAIDTDKLMAGHVADSQTLCGFDAQKDRLPQHISGGCNTIRRMTFAYDNGFTVAGPASWLLPLTPDGLKLMLKHYAGQPLYEKGALKGGALSTGE